MRVEVRIHLAYEIDTTSYKKAVNFVENVELPKEYIEDSFEIIQIRGKSNECIHCYGRKKIFGYKCPYCKGTGKEKRK